ncbi:MAG: ribose-5-phosphate isomerase RpiA [Candidatus Hydrothermarchaeales archaeon]
MNLKELSAISAVKLVEDGQILGLGTGSTMYYAIREIGRRIREEGLEILGIATSIATEKLAKENGIPLTTLQEHQGIDIDIDGADQVDKDLNLIKGGGGAHFREKIVALCAKKFVVIVDESKLVEKLDMPVPVEVLPFAWRIVSNSLGGLNGNPKLRLLNDQPFITDNKNLILDVDFGVIRDPGNLEGEINSIVGVIENGIFTGLTSEVHVGTRDGVKILKG